MSEQTSEAQPKQEFNLSLLAKEKFGDQFKGEIEPDPQPEEEIEDAVEEEDIEEPEEDSEETTDEDSEDDNEESQEEVITSFSELVETQEWEPEWAENLEVEVKVNGETSKVPLKDLKANYQMNTAADQRLEEAKEKAKSLQQEMTEKSEALQGQFAVAANLIQGAEEMLDQDVSSIDWKSLREDDPAEYSAKKSEIAERREKIEQMKRDATEKYQKSVQTLQQQSQEELREHLAREQDALLEKLPEWKDEKTQKAEKSKLIGFLKDTGFSEQDIQGASDHRLILLARKAMLYDEGLSKVQTAKKKVSKVPKVVKPGASKDVSQSSKAKAQKAKNRLKKTGSIDAAFEYMQARKKQR